MTDSSHEPPRADAPSAPVAVPDRQILGAVHTGLLLVPSEPPSSLPAVGRRRDEDAAPQLAVRRRKVV